MPGSWPLYLERAQRPRGLERTFRHRSVLMRFGNSGDGTDLKRRRHIILLSDGKTKKADFVSVAERLKKSGITVSTINIGEPQDSDILQELAVATKGRFYMVDKTALSNEELSHIFTQDTVMASEEWFVTEPVKTKLKDPIDGLERVLSSLDNALPVLYGYVRTTPKKSATVLLESGYGDPIIAAWHYGDGRAVAFPPDGSGYWTSRWLNWPPFQGLWTNLTIWAMAPQKSDHVEESQETFIKSLLLNNAVEDTGVTPDYPQLKRVADMTGGRFLSPGDNPFERVEGKKNISREFRPVCLAIIFCLYTLDVAIYKGVRIPVNLQWFRTLTLRRRKVAQ